MNKHRVEVSLVVIVVVVVVVVIVLVVEKSSSSSSSSSSNNSSSCFWSSFLYFSCILSFISALFLVRVSIFTFPRYITSLNKTGL